MGWPGRISPPSLTGPGASPETATTSLSTWSGLGEVLPISLRSSGGDPGPGGGVYPGALNDAEISLVRREPDTATALGAETATLLGTVLATARDIKIGGSSRGGTGLL